MSVYYGRLVCRRFPVTFLSSPTSHLRSIARRQRPQWFLKQGDAHPLKAIGVVATIIVFGSAVLVKEAWTFL
jgi:hypothetical protein